MPEAAPLPAIADPAVDHAPAIRAIGTALPERRVETEEIAARLGVDADWVVQRTGVRERRIAGDGDSLTALAVEAGARALAAAGTDPAELDLVLVATCTADRLLPNAAPLVAAGVGARAAAACDVGAACSGFLAGLSLAAAQIESGRAHHVLVVGADLMSRVTDRGDRKTAGLFADGAGAAVLGAGGPGSLGRVLLRSDAAGAECVVVEQGERLLRMHGQDTFRAAVEALADVTAEVVGAEGLAIDDIDLFVYHQANARITGAVGERLGLRRDRVVDCIERYGNTSAATLPLALEHAAGDGRLQPGARVLLGAFAAGFVWGAGLISWHGEVAS